MEWIKNSGYGMAFDGGDWWSFVMALLEIKFLVLMIIHHHMLTISK